MRSLAEILELLTIEAHKCTDVAIARQKWQEALGGSHAEEVWEARWIELANAEADEEAPRCTATATARQKWHEALGESHAEEVWEARWIELKYDL